MVELNNEITSLKTQINLLQGESAVEVVAKGTELNDKLRKRWIMIAGEGSVFLGVLILGIFQVRKTFKKEKELAFRQKNFLLSVTHELKSPIASTKLQLQTLQKHELHRDKQLEILSNAISDTNRLNNLVENILLAARIDNGTYPLHKERYNLSEYILEGMNQTLASAGVKQKVILDINPGIYMEIDRTNFPSIILNLFENASKYSPEDSTITISLKKREDKIYLSVSDQGTGITDEDKKNIFLKFYRSGNEETRKSKGTGLGLYIVSYLVEQHNGSVSVRDNAPKGSVFEVVYPSE